ncbi:MAG: hypothetical protein ACTHU7_11955, partial [Microbacterium sp.]
MKRPWMFVAAIAAVTALVISIGASGIWLLVHGSGHADGSREQLTAAGVGGGWHGVTEPAPLEVEGDGELRELDGFPSDAESWLVQLTVRAAEAPAVLASGDVPLLRVAAGETASVSHLLRTVDASTLEVSGDAELQAEALASFSAPDLDSGRPSPGGSVAVVPFEVVDTERSLGIALGEDAAGFSPLGLGGLPSSGVAAVWLQVDSIGGSVAVGGSEERVALARTSALTLAPLDADGRVWLEAADDVQRVRASVVGWMAGADADLDRAVVERGIMAATTPTAQATSTGGAASVEQPEFVPAAATGLYLVSSGDGAGAVGADERDSMQTRFELAGGSASAIVASEGDVAAPDGAQVRLLGYIAGEEESAPAGTASADEPSVSITAPDTNADLRIVDSGATVTIEGTASGGTGGIRSVWVTEAGRHVGAANVRPGADGGLTWQLTT